MHSKFLIFIGMIIGSLVGGYIPVIFGGDIISYTSVLTSAVGALIGIFIAFKITPD